LPSDEGPAVGRGAGEQRSRGAKGEEGEAAIEEREERKFPSHTPMAASHTPHSPAPPHPTPHTPAKFHQNIEIKLVSRRN